MYAGGGYLFQGNLCPIHFAMISRQSLGCGGIMESLVRTRVERFAIEDSIRLEEAEELMQAGKLTEQYDSGRPDVRRLCENCI